MSCLWNTLRMYGRIVKYEIQMDDTSLLLKDRHVDCFLMQLLSSFRSVICSGYWITSESLYLPAICCLWGFNKYPTVTTEGSVGVIVGMTLCTDHHVSHCGGLQCNVMGCSKGARGKGRGGKKRERVGLSEFTKIPH